MSKAPQIFFFFLSGSKKGKIEPADAQVVRIGRQPYCELKLDPYQDIPASGDHCHVIREEDGYYLLDSGSTFGTWLNGNKISGRVKLSTGDVIQCGLDENGGREGPRLKFYLEDDVRKCPVCNGPVYKRHFRCPECRKKCCLRCIDFNRKICQVCAKVPAKAKSAGFEVVEDDNVTAKRPAKVIVSGKEAKKVKKAQAAKEATNHGKKTAPEDDLSVPFCLICQEFVKGARFVCPACGQEVCATHRQGKVCRPCAGVSPEPVATKKTKVARPAIMPTDLGDDLEAEPIVAEPVPVPGTQWGPKDKTTKAGVPRAQTPPPAPRPAQIPGTEEEPAPPTMRFRADGPPPTKKGTHQIKAPSVPAVKTGVASCARCRGPLGAGTFCCRACRRILCFAHVAVDDVCEDCYLAGKDRAGGPRGAPPTPTAMPRPAPFFPEAERPPGHRTTELPPSSAADIPGRWDPEKGATLAEIEALDMMPLLDTEKEEDSSLSDDDDLARPPPGTSSEDAGLMGLSFVCPHCDAPLDASARACPRCRKVL